MKKIIIYSCVFIVGFVLYIAFSITTYADKRNVVSSDAAIVLGAGIKQDQPSPVFRERINHGVNLYKEGVVKKLIFTGGLCQGQTYAES